MVFLDVLADELSHDVVHLFAAITQVRRGTAPESRAEDNCGRLMELVPPPLPRGVTVRHKVSGKQVAEV